MAGFIRRFTSQPSIETLAEIEGVDIVDLDPNAPTTGIGSGTLLCVGEFEDGPFAAGGDSVDMDPIYRNTGPQEVFGSEDLANRFGGFGFTYGALRYQNPAARRQSFELWNGNGFVKLKFVKSKRLMIARADTSVGEVAFSPLAFIGGDVGPYQLTPGQQVSATSDTGGPALSTAIAAVVATVVGGIFVTSGFAGGESIDITIDGGPAVRVAFSAADSTPTQVAARINLVLGYTAATVGAGAITIVGLRRGTGGSVTLANVSAGALTAIGHAAATTAGTGNVANVDSVTAAEVAAIVNGTAALLAINVGAVVGPAGEIRIVRTGGAGTLIVAAGTLATALGLDPIGSVVTAGQHAGGTIPAGTRVRTAGGLEWVTMQTLVIGEGTATAPKVGPHIVKVRPANDIGTAVGTTAATVTTLVDVPSFAMFSVTNPVALGATKTPAQMDNAYLAALDATLDPAKVTREATFSLVARRTDEVVRAARQNAITASAEGLFGRKYIASAPIGFTQAQATADVALWRTDRLFYTWPGVKVRLPEIAELGEAGGTGFTSDGVIVVRADGPLATLNCRLNPEENPGQDTEGLVDEFFALEDTSAPLRIDAYIALRAAGICAPRVDNDSGMIFQSGVTSSLTPGRTTQARRKMADFIQDTIARRLLPLSKKLATPARRDAARGIMEDFLGELLSVENEEAARIAGYLIDERSAQTAGLTARGIFATVVKVQTLSSLDKFALQTEIGEGVVTTTEL